MTETTLNWQVMDDADTVAGAAYESILDSAEEAITLRGRFRIVLAGGSTPLQVYRMLADAHAEWPGWEIYYGDERCLPRDDPERNSLMAKQAWLSKVDIPASQVHMMPAERGAGDLSLIHI